MAFSHLSELLANPVSCDCSYRGFIQNIVSAPKHNHKLDITQYMQFTLQNRYNPFKFMLDICSVYGLLDEMNSDQHNLL